MSMRGTALRSVMVLVCGACGSSCDEEPMGGDGGVVVDAANEGPDAEGLPPLPAQARLYTAAPVELSAADAEAIAADLGVTGTTTSTSTEFVITDGARAVVVGRQSGSIAFHDRGKLWRADYTSDLDEADAVAVADAFLATAALDDGDLTMVIAEEQWADAPDLPNHWRVSYRYTLDGYSVSGATLDVLVGAGEVIGLHRNWRPLTAGELVTVYDEARLLELAAAMPEYSLGPPDRLAVVYVASSASAAQTTVAPYAMAGYALDEGIKWVGLLPASDQSPELPRAANPTGVFALTPPDYVQDLGPGPCEIASAEWSLTATISPNDGLVLSDVAFSEHRLARSLSVPYFSYQTESAPRTSAELTAAAASDGIIYAHWPNGMFVVSVTYRFPQGMGGPCDANLSVTQAYIFSPEETGCGAEHGPCARFVPVVSYNFSASLYEDFGVPSSPACPEHSLSAFDVVHRQDYDFAARNGRERVAFYADIDGTDFGNLHTQHPPAVEVSNVMADYGGRGEYDNFHARTPGEHVFIPGCSGPPRPINLFWGGFYQCSHHHWRWASHLGEPFGSGNILIPPNQRVTLYNVTNDCPLSSGCSFDPPGFSLPLTMSPAEPIGVNDPDQVLYQLIESMPLEPTVVGTFFTREQRDVLDEGAHHFFR